MVASFLLLVLCLALGGPVLFLVANHNFHVVSNGIVYRSGQMSAKALDHVIRAHGIKSILNLRGAWNDGWYAAEIKTAQSLGVQHYDFALSASRELTDEEMDRILAMIKAAPKPLLIHCKSGSDRTGLAGALYLYEVEGQSAHSAGRQLTFLYGHVPYLFWNPTAAMDRSYWRFVRNHPKPAQASGVSTNRAPPFGILAFPTAQPTNRPQPI